MSESRPLAEHLEVRVDLAGDLEAIRSALDEFEQTCLKVGLSLNISKCELILSNGGDDSIARAAFPAGIQVVSNGCFKLLGAPIGDSMFCSSYVSRQTDKIGKGLDALAGLDNPQVALLLLRQGTSFGKMVHLMRTVPFNAHEDTLATFDNRVRSCFEGFTHLRPTDGQWLQATLAVRLSGLGIRSCKSHAPAAYLSSRSQCHKLCSELDASHEWEVDTPCSAAAEAKARIAQAVTDDYHVGGQESYATTYTCSHRQTIKPIVRERRYHVGG